MAVWLIWLIAAAALAIAEALSLNLVLIMTAGGAGAAALVAALGLAAPLQVAVFAVVSLGLLVLARPIAIRHLLPNEHVSKTGVEALVGRTATVISTVDAHNGRIKIGGDEWSAQSYDGHQVLETGDVVQVMEIRGVTALVWAEP
jgi:membrane protein implicated in regulation of membrane protease activity